MKKLIAISPRSSLFSFAVVVMLSNIFNSQTAYAQPACSSYTNYTGGMWIGPGSYCGSPYGGSTVSSNGRLYTHRGYCSNTGPGSWDFQDIGACTSCTNPSVPSSLSAASVTCTGFTAQWNASTNSPTGYLLDVSTVSNFASFVTGYNGKNVGNVTSSAVTGLSSGFTYYYRVRAFKTGCVTSGNSTTITQATLSIPAQPSAIAGSATPCQGSSQAYSVTNVAGVTYTWAFPSGW